MRNRGETGNGLTLFSLLSVQLWTSPILDVYKEGAHTRKHTYLTPTHSRTHIKQTDTYANKPKTHTHTLMQIIHKRLTQVAEILLYRSSPRSI